MNIDLQNIDKCDLSEEHSNFMFLGIGKETDAQKTRGAKIQKALHDASVNISNTSHDAIKSTKDAFNDAGKNISSTTKVAVKNISTTIGDKLGGGIAVHAANKFNPFFITLRGAVLSLININIVGLASSLDIIKNSKNQKHWSEILQKWWMWGGEKDSFTKSVEKHKDKKHFLEEAAQKLFKKKHGFDGVSNADGKVANVAGVAIGTTAALLGVAAAVATAEQAYPVAAWLGAGSGGLAAMTPIFKNFAQENGATPEQTDAISPPPTTVPQIPQSAITPSLAQYTNLPIGFNPDTLNNSLPQDPKTLDKVADEMNAMTQAQQSGKDHTLVSVHADPAVNDDILGMPRTVVYIGIGVLVLIGGFLIARRVIKNNS